MSKNYLTDAATLELYRVALENAGTQPEISTEMAELGYDAAKIAEGKALLAQTRAAYDTNITEDDETTVAYALFTSKKEELTKIYMHHRKKAKVVFRKDSLIADKLAVLGEMPRTYVNLLEAANFTKLQVPMPIFKVSWLGWPSLRNNLRQLKPYS